MIVQGFLSPFVRHKLNLISPFNMDLINEFKVTKVKVTKVRNFSFFFCEAEKFQIRLS